MEFKDYYQILGVPSSAGQDEIRKAYRKLARQHHPDVNPGNSTAEEQFKDINEANEVLSDPEKRRTYDQAAAAHREGRRVHAGVGAGAGAAAAPPAGGVRYHTVSAEDLHDLYGDQHPFSDFFANLFGAGAARPPRPSRGVDLDYPLQVTLAEAYGGSRRLLEMQQPDGTTKRVEATIPAGVRDGTRLRLAGLGGTGDPPGDLYLEITVQSDPHYQQEGDDLIVAAPARLTDAALGGETMVTKPDGRRLAVRIPAGTQDGRRIRLRGQGLPRVVARPEQTVVRGDLLAEVHVRLPEPLTEEQRRLFEQLRGEGA